MLKVAVIGIAAVLLAVQLKQMKAEFSTYISFAVGLLIFFYALHQLEYIVDAINRMQGFMKVNQVYIGILMKMIGIAYVAEFSSSICRDSGYQSIAGQIEVFGKLTILAVSMPIVLALLDTIDAFLS